MPTSLDRWLNWHSEGKYTTLPLIVEIPAEWLNDDYLASWREVWEDASPYAFVLESGKEGKFTYLGLRPSSMIRGAGSVAESFDYADVSEQLETRHVWEGGPLEVVRSWMKPWQGPRISEEWKWTGGCIGYWSYDVIRLIERLPEMATKDLNIPDYVFLRMNELYVLNHQSQKIYAVVHTSVTGQESHIELEQLYQQACKRAEGMSDYWLTWFEREKSRERMMKERNHMRRLVETESLHIDVEAMTDMESPFSKEDYMRAVRRIQQYIMQGDTFQVNLSQRLSRKLHASSEELYEWLRVINPSPYMGFLKLDQFQLVSASPELLVELAGGKLGTRPIAGTRRRGRTAEEEARFVEELRTSEKEVAEHIMLVDLERNDLGRVSKYGSVHVKELMVIERYSHVMHLVSQVDGEIAAGKDAFDVIAATFPGGTITGAPKIRTMEIIEELEPVRRGPYTGSMGWIDYNGDMEFNILIRTMVVHEGNVHVQAGAGIVIDSEPEREYYESLNKAKALWKAVQYSESSTV